MRICVSCGSSTTRRQYGYEKWHGSNGCYLCSKCYNRYITNPKWNKSTHLRRVNIRGKIQVQLKENPRKGICQKCKKAIGDEYVNYKGQIMIVKRTHIHHLQYHDNDPLRDTIELCASCHDREHWKLGKKIGPRKVKV